MLFRLGREIAELGPVNLAALDELTVARERKGEFTELFAELQALIDYLKSVVNYETAQVAPLGAGAGVTVVSGATGTAGTGQTGTSSTGPRQQ